MDPDTCHEAAGRALRASCLVTRRFSVTGGEGPQPTGTPPELRGINNAEDVIVYRVYNPGAAQ